MSVKGPDVGKTVTTDDSSVTATFDAIATFCQNTEMIRTPLSGLTHYLLSEYPNIILQLCLNAYFLDLPPKSYAQATIS